MNKKLTLTLEQTVFGKAKKYAHSKGRSLSDIIENYLKVITKEDDTEKIELTPIVKSMKGSFKAPKDLDYKIELSKRLTGKYLSYMQKALIDTSFLIEKQAIKET